MQPGATLTAGDGHAGADADADLGCPFLAVSARFDDIAPIVRDDPRDSGQELLRWVTGAALEQRERLRAFSSFYTAREPATLMCLETIARFGYGSAEMARRLELVKSRLE